MDGLKPCRDWFYDTILRLSVRFSECLYKGQWMDASLSRDVAALYVPLGSRHFQSAPRTVLYPEQFGRTCRLVHCSRLQIRRTSLRSTTRRPYISARPWFSVRPVIYLSLNHFDLWGYTFIRIRRRFLSGLPITIRILWIHFLVDTTLTLFVNWIRARFPCSAGRLFAFLFSLRYFRSVFLIF